MNGHDFVKGNVNFDISDPESKCSVDCDIYGAHEVVPEPRQQHEVGNSDNEDGAVCADRHGCDHEY